MSVHQKKDGRWFVKYYINDNDTGGRKKEKREFYGRGPVAEQQACERDEALKAAGKISSYTIGVRKAMAPTFRDLAEEYLQARVNDLPGTSIQNMIYKLKGVILPELGSLDYSKITAHRLDQYVTKRKASVKRTTIHRELSDIIAILNFAAARKIIPKNPVIGYKKPRRDDAVIRPPDEQETQQILRHAAGHLQRALLINYYTGLRPGNSELHHITYDDVDWHNQTLLIRSADKGGPVKRSVAIHPALQRYLKKWQAEDQGNPHPYIIHYRAKPVLSLKTAFKAAKRRAGITRRLRPYDFRHAAITTMILNGDLKATSQIAGHSNVEMTIRQYEHITSDIKKKTIESINEIDF